MTPAPATPGPVGRDSAPAGPAATTPPTGSAGRPLPAADGYPLSPVTDYYGLFAGVQGEDLEAWQAAHALTEPILARINEAWEAAEYPMDLVRLLADSDLLTDGLDIPGHRRLSPLGAGLVTMEMSRIDGSMGTVVGVQAGLCARSIALLGSQQQKEQWLPALASAEKLGAFALTEPDHGSDSVALETVARREGNDWVITGEKKWIGNGANCDVSVVWARVDDETDEKLHGQVSGFIVEQHLDGYSADVIDGKLSLRAIHQAHIRMDGVRVPLDARLPEARSFKDTGRVLAATRAGVAWGALGHAIACFEIAAQYAKDRTQFGRPLAKSQHVQVRLADMLQTLVGAQLHCFRVAQLDEAGTLTPVQASMAKVHCTRAARSVAAEARDLLGGVGILLENHVIRHMADIEALHTYEGTDTIQSLLVGREIAGVSAFA
ncbi:acyl-CoA dehydrogenase family protein [Helcobacillus massiliensis]|uniref:acyl-CoA dehydrogenase family protein n=1 Tax=Helcobacillus massiliensis TaxID=521392 RepID=UPI002556027C|nr:acyl-CoA dehydrogenase family protein [Helcobacillus massiliensis]MDK7741604.1 acyl-CoA dehydrogenase family protein [Helcobacillus massiliensis]WOO92650.1 acyl-CoA dehydrogenase family protein [Helcobacillus massiliensis]